ncbi:MAG: hypothetical protein JWN72_1527 [Thermoleophilia bacterium]|nr:hypothetical protein [Thermoleophilia bacterium]
MPTPRPRTTVPAPASAPVRERRATPEYARTAAPLVYWTVGTGLLVCLTSLLIARGSFGIGTVALALLLVAPFLLYARLAIARPGVEAVLAGILLLAVGIWGSISAIGDSGAWPFIRLPLELLLLVCATFGAGALLRGLVPVRRDEARPR